MMKAAFISLLILRLYKAAEENLPRQQKFFYQRRGEELVNLSTLREIVPEGCKFNPITNDLLEIECQEAIDSSEILALESLQRMRRKLSTDCSTDANCQTCAGSGQTCSECAVGYYLDSSECQQCDSSCLTCSSSGCLTCTDGTGSCCPSTHYFDGLLCEKCPENCTECSDAQTCIKCLDSLLVPPDCCPDNQSLVNGQCTCSNGLAEDTDCKCPENQYYNNWSGICECKNGKATSNDCLCDEGEIFNISCACANQYSIESDCQCPSKCTDQCLAVLFDTGPRIYVTTDQDVSVKAYTNCEDTYPEYNWTFQGIDNNEDPEGSPLDLEQTNNSRFNTGNGKLKAGYTYIYKCETTDTRGTALLYVHVLYSALYVKINKENQAVSSSLDLQLDSSSSNDPDNADLTYRWTCTDAGGVECKGSDNQSLIYEEPSSMPSINIQQDRLIELAEMKITLEIVTSDGRIASDQCDLKVRDVGNSEVQLLNPVSKVNAQKELLISLDVKEGNSIIWYQESGDKLTPSSNLNMPVLRFSENTMTEGENYTFKAVIHNQLGQVMDISLEWSALVSPICQSDIQITDDNIFYVHNCSSENLPLTYSFGTNGNLCTPRSTSNKGILKLFSGNWTITSQICDSLGLCILKHKEFTLDLEDSSAAITDQFTQAMTDQFDIPCLVNSFTKNFILNRNNWDFIFGELSEYSLESLDEHTMSVLIGSTVEMIKESSELVTALQGLSFISQILEQRTMKPMIADLEKVAEITSEIAQQYPSDHSIIDTLKLVNVALVESTPPNDSLRTFEFFPVLSQVNRTLGSDLKAGFSLQTARNYHVSIREMPELDDSEIIDLHVIAISDNTIDVSLYSAGVYTKEIITMIFNEKTSLRTMTNLNHPVNITIPYVFESGHGCYYLSNNNWVYDENIEVIHNSNSTTILTPHLSTFKVDMVTLNTSEDCVINTVSIASLIGILIAYPLVFWLFSKIKPYHKNTPKIGPESQDMDNENLKDLETNEPGVLRLFALHHLTCGQMKPYYIKRIKRACLLLIGLLGDLAFVGLFLNLFFDQLSMNDYTAAFSIAFLASFSVFIILSTLEIISVPFNVTNDRVSWTLIGLIFILEISSLISLSLELCDISNTIIATSYVIAIALDVLLFQSLHSLFKIFITKRVVARNSLVWTEES